MVQKDRFVNPQLKWRSKKSKNAFFIIPANPGSWSGAGSEIHRFHIGRVPGHFDKLIYPSIYAIR